MTDTAVGYKLYFRGDPTVAVVVGDVVGSGVDQMALGVDSVYCSDG